MKIIFFLGSLFAKNATAAIMTTTTALSASTWFLGFDVLPWVIGAFGAAITQVYRPPETRPKAIANSSISIFLGGLVSPFLGSSVWLSENFKNKDYAIYAIAFILAATWPWLIPILLNGFSGIVKKLTDKIDD